MSNMVPRSCVRKCDVAHACKRGLRRTVITKRAPPGVPEPGVPSHSGKVYCLARVPPSPFDFAKYWK